MELRSKKNLPTFTNSRMPPEDDTCSEHSAFSHYNNRLPQPERASHYDDYNRSPPPGRASHFDNYNRSPQPERASCHDNYNRSPPPERASCYDNYNRSPRPERVSRYDRPTSTRASHFHDDYNRLTSLPRTNHHHNYDRTPTPPRYTANRLPSPPNRTSHYDDFYNPPIMPQTTWCGQRRQQTPPEIFPQNNRRPWRHFHQSPTATRKSQHERSYQWHNRAPSPQNNQPTWRPQTKLPSFAGKSDEWNSFWVQFKMCAKRCKFDDEEFAAQLLMCLKGNALSYATSLGEEILDDAHRFSNAMKKRFSHSMPAQTHRASLNSIRKSASETIQDYASRVESAMLKAYPDIEETETFTQLTIQQFLGGFYDQDLAMDILKLNPKSLTDAVDQLTWMESCKQNNNKRQGHRLLHYAKNDSTNSPSEEDSSEEEERTELRRINGKRFVTEDRLMQYDRDSTSRLKKLLLEIFSEGKTDEEINKLLTEKLDTDKTTGSRPPTYACYNCNVEGHLSANYPQPSGRAFNQNNMTRTSSFKHDVHLPGIQKQHNFDDDSPTMFNPASTTDALESEEELQLKPGHLQMINRAGAVTIRGPISIRGIETKAVTDTGTEADDVEDLTPTPAVLKDPDKSLMKKFKFCVNKRDNNTAICERTYKPGEMVTKVMSPTYYEIRNKAKTIAIHGDRLVPYEDEKLPGWATALRKKLSC